MKRLIFLLLYILQLPTLSAQIFRPPMDHEITFAGNFGEIRTDHFHGGLDFKTGGAEGKVVRALADGYISRVQINAGSGLVLTVNYADGYSSAYRHLSAFAPPIAARAKSMQYENESWEIDYYPQPDEYPVKAGQQIALSGNTGYSMGPHLHLDLFNAAGEYIDPLPFFLAEVNDHTPPRADGFLLIPAPGAGVIEGRQDEQTFPIDTRKTIDAWGLIGAGIKAYDYMDGVHNRYGVKFVSLSVDGEEVFRSVVDRFAYDENRYINSWTRGQYMKSFIEPGNRLRMLQAMNDDGGLIRIDEERPYRLVYTLSDAFGNTTQVGLTLRGRRQEIAPLPYAESDILHHDRVNVLQKPGVDLVIPRHALYRDAYLTYQQSLPDSAAASYTYRLTDEAVKLHRAADLSIGLRRRPVDDVSKYHIVRIDPGGRRHSVGGSYERGFIHTSILQLGTFCVEVDTVPPTVRPLNQARWGQSGKVTLRADDAQSGISHFAATVDGAWAPLGKPNAVSGHLVLELDPEHVTRGRNHRLTVSVTDGCGNVTDATYSFYW